MRKGYTGEERECDAYIVLDKHIGLYGHTAEERREGIQVAWAQKPPLCGMMQRLCKRPGRGLLGETCEHRGALRTGRRDDGIHGCVHVGVRQVHVPRRRLDESVLYREDASLIRP